MVTTKRNRGQLILIGAIAVALLVVGIAVVVNAVLYTENVRPSETTSQLDEATEIDHEVRRSARSLILRVNHQDIQRSANEVGQNAAANITSLGQILGESYVNTRPMQVDASYENDSSAFGKRFVMQGDYGFNMTDRGSTTGQSTWDPIDAGSGSTEIGWALLNVNTTETDDERFHVNFTGDRGDLDVTFNKTSSRTYNITTEAPGGTTGPVACEAQGDRALLDLVHGQSYTDDTCTFNGSMELGPIETVTFDNAENPWGRYSFVADDSSVFENGEDCGDPSSTAIAPCNTPAVWTANISTTMTGDAFSYSNEYNVSIYEVAN